MPADHSEYTDTPAALPEVIDYTPSIRCFDMDGARAVCGEAGIGWRADQRAYPPVTVERKLLVPIAPESEHYRAADDGEDPATELWEADQVWIETLAPNTGKLLAPMPTLFERLVNPDIPPSRTPIPAADVAFLLGRRLWWWSRESFHDDYRALSEPFEEDGDIFVRITDEASWYRWQRLGSRPRVTDAFIQHLWAQ
ncbi:hypothetical protein [Salininema proteolyticum]|uniref:Uncharacterized protein n=1 Tax=Salininema proteolyticum TaxID=1607685 RepID=A0ABV8TWM6_9ACTN